MVKSFNEAWENKNHSDFTPELPSFPFILKSTRIPEIPSCNSRCRNASFV
jgi:hypothetical protein